MSTDPTASAHLAPVLSPRPIAALRALRLHQWVKNVLVFVPLLGAHRIDDRRSLVAAALAFVAFGLVASAVYVINDLVDVAADRRHPQKRHRPFASGALPPAAGVVLAPLPLAAGAALSFALPPSFRVLLAGYFAATLAYTFYVKRKVVADVLLLAGLYTARMFAGGLATGIPVSEWLASFAMFLFLSLAFLKRASEFGEVEGGLEGRGYRSGDREVVFAMGTASGYLAVLVLALYVSSEDVRRLYDRPTWLWALCPLVLYWISRLWIAARRSEVKRDPLVHALAQRYTWVVAAVGSLVVALAT